MVYPEYVLILSSVKTKIWMFGSSVDLLWFLWVQPFPKLCNVAFLLLSLWNEYIIFIVPFYCPHSSMHGAFQIQLLPSSWRDCSGNGVALAGAGGEFGPGRYRGEERRAALGALAAQQPCASLPGNLCRGSSWHIRLRRGFGIAAGSEGSAGAPHLLRSAGNLWSFTLQSLGRGELCFPEF